MTGEVAVFFDTPITALPQIRAGTVRALGVSTRKRLVVAPEIPTIAEAGLSDYEVTGWNGVLAPANTPRPIIDKLNRPSWRRSRRPTSKSSSSSKALNLRVTARRSLPK